MTKRYGVIAVLFPVFLVVGAAYAQTLMDTSAAMNVGGAVEGSSAATAAATARSLATAAAAVAATAPSATGPSTSAQNPAALNAPLTDQQLHATFQGSFFLTPLEMAAIDEALHGRVLKAATLQGQSQPVPTYRVIRVSGVLYRSPIDWVVWMNNKKVTPSSVSLLPEIIDISVKDSSKVSLKWYDVGLNQVISITLHPHETYDIPTGILIPGTY